MFASLSCGTYSVLRSADTLPKGQVELNAGLAANGIGEVVPVGQVAVGVHDRVDVFAQWELWNAFAEARAAVFKSELDGIAVTIGIGGGVASTALEEASDTLQGVENDAAMVGSVYIGRRFDWLDVYLANRTLWLVPSFTLNSTKLGVRLNASEHFRFIIEGGATVHHGAFTLAEATVAIGTGW